MNLSFFLLESAYQMYHHVTGNVEFVSDKDDNIALVINGIPNTLLSFYDVVFRGWFVMVSSSHLRSGPVF